MAAVPVVYGTAELALRHRAQLKPGALALLPPAATCCRLLSSACLVCGTCESALAWHDEACM